MHTFNLLGILSFRLELRRPHDVISRGRYLMWFRHAVFLLSSCFLSSADSYCIRAFFASYPRKVGFLWIDGIPSPAYARTCYSSLRLSDLVGYLDTTDRVPSRTAAVPHAVYCSVVEVYSIRRSPIEAIKSSTKGSTVCFFTGTCGWKEHLRSL